MNTRGSTTHTKKYKLIVSAVHMVYRLVNSTFNTQELSLRLTRLICQFVKANSASIYILDDKKRKISMVAIFDNKINILKVKKRELAQIPEKEKKVTEGYAIFEKHLIGLPLVAYENIGAILIRRKKNEPPFDAFDREMLSVVAEQAVTAIKNLQLHESQQKIILSSMEFIGTLLRKVGNVSSSTHLPVYFKIVKALAEKLNMSKEWIDNLYYANVIRDAGAIDVPFDILSKKSQLTAEEFRIIKEQPAKSAELIRPVEFLKPVLPIILYRNEHYDGTGYPSGLKRNQIPLGARIMAVVDAFEAMIKDRPYKKRRSVDEAVNEIKRNSGTQFDPKVVNIFVGICKQKKFRKYLS